MFAIPNIDYIPDSVRIDDEKGTRFVQSWNAPEIGYSNAYVGGTTWSDPIRLYARIVDGLVVDVTVHGPTQGCVPSLHWTWCP